MSDLIPFTFETSEVRVLSREGEPWFILADVCRVLEYSDSAQAARNLDEGEVDTLHNMQGITDSRNGIVKLVSESGLYSPILTSRKPAAKRFERWICEEVLPSIRKTGRYDTGEARKEASVGLQMACEALQSSRVVHGKGEQGMKKLIKSQYQDVDIAFAENGWINATGIAEKFGKRIDHWLENKETQDYIAALEADEDSGLHTLNSGYVENGKQNQAVPNTRNSGYVKTSRARLDRGGGTWLHPDLAVFFARWLNVRFAIWCDRQIKAILSGQHPHYDWKRLRHEASSSFKIMNAMLKMQRQKQGKEVAPHHFSNEARLVNWALTGKFDAVNRETLEESDLNRLAKLEVYNTLLIGNGLKYDERKKALECFAADCRMPRIATTKTAVIEMSRPA